MYYPIEIKKTSSPKQIDISSGKLLKLLDINVGVNTIICNVDKVTHLSKDIIAVPFNGI
ncbi:hypothetical protein FACS189496_2780 [Bacilli bacterium]|nr:hypothetical protein FACS189496_2780 [Bacilli bacterium]